ncbi:MAG: 8-amino-7-oxononanoate synthase [Parvibaculaceae bacterium]|nr:8-amino-7-oxononanoate synthase [Parvibaculaceae bacterium]HBM87759.1 8-amino-7-oxononanoate synthase [Rhodobiaceae bacterium]|tara:strand:- start:324 stop:1490 length:1167 start_codon:yes stop_codon:yes gene_type:complete
MSSLDDMALRKLAELEAGNLRRRLKETDRNAGAYVVRDGRTLISFCCNDYLNLAHDPRVIEAAKHALDERGASSGASRLVTGNHSIFTELERRLAALKQTDDCVVLGSGYLANLGIIPTLMKPGDLVLADELSHSCLLSGTDLSGATSFRFRHNDMAHLTELLETHRAAAKHCLIVTDGVFSMDGDLAPVAEMAEMAKLHDAWLMTDDAHGIGVLAEGRGSSFVTGTKADVPLQMGTLSKAIGSYGGYICASQPVIDLLRTRARTLIYSTGLPPASAAAAIAALDIIETEPDYAALPVEKANRFTRALNLPAAESPIVPLVLGDPETTLKASAFLEEEGFLVTAIRPPTVPKGTARLRFTFTALHKDKDIDRLADLVRTQILNKRAAE